MTSQLDLIPSADASDVEEHRTEAEWLRVRRSAIGASEAPVILGVSTFSSPLKLYTDKLEITKPETRTLRQRRGLASEPFVAELYEEETGHKLHDPGRYALRRSRALPWMVATLDREIVAAEGHAVPAVLELKTRAWAPAGLWEDEPPLDVMVQVQHQLAVTGWTWAAVAVLLRDEDFRRFTIQRHEPFIKKLIDAELEFLARLKTKTAPPADAHHTTREALRALYPRETPGLVVNLPGEAVEWDAIRQESIKTKKAAEAAQEEAENKLKAALGEAETGVLPNGVQFTYKASERAGYTVAPTTVRTLRRKDAR